MYRIFSFLIVALAIALGLVIGTLNAEPARIDLLWVQLQWPLGLIILSAVAAGLFLGLLLAWLFSILPLKSRLKKVSVRQDPYDNGKLQNGND